MEKYFLPQNKTYHLNNGTLYTEVFLSIEISKIRGAIRARTTPLFLRSLLDSIEIDSRIAVGNVFFNL